MRTKKYRKNKKYRKSKRFFIKKKNYKKRKYSKKQIGRGNTQKASLNNSINNKQLCSKFDKQIETITNGQSLYECLIEIYKGAPYKQEKNDEINKKIVEYKPLIVDYNKNRRKNPGEKQQEKLTILKNLEEEIKKLKNEVIEDIKNTKKYLKCYFEKIFKKLEDMFGRENDAESETVTLSITGFEAEYEQTVSNGIKRLKLSKIIRPINYKINENQQIIYEFESKKQKGTCSNRLQKVSSHDTTFDILYEVYQQEKSKYKEFAIKRIFEYFLNMTEGYSWNRVHDKNQDKYDNPLKEGIGYYTDKKKLYDAFSLGILYPNENFGMTFIHNIEKFDLIEESIIKRIEAKKNEEEAKAKETETPW